MKSEDHVSATSLALVRFAPLLLLLILVLVGCPRARGQQSSEFDALVAQVAASIQNPAKKLPPHPRILVLDFEETLSTRTLGTASELAHAFTAQFTEALQKHASGFTVLGREDMQQAIENRHLPDGVLSNLPATKCYVADFGATVSIEGRMEYAPERVVLDVSARNVENHHATYLVQKVILPMTPEMKALALKPAPSPAAIFTQENTVWINPDHPPISGEGIVDFVEREPKGYALVGCEKCKNPEFTQNAVTAKMQGIVLLRVQVLSDGYPSKISVIRGLPCGLTDRSIEAVKHWKFKPAIGPDGTPVAAELPIEVTFRLY
jgi:TonB family protein